MRVPVSECFTIDADANSQEAEALAVLDIYRECIFLG